MFDLFRLIHDLVFWWVIAKFFLKLYKAFKTFVLPRVVGEYNLIEKFGSWAVITGSTDGVGKGLARELARRGLNVVLISRSAEKLQLTASEIGNYLLAKPFTRRKIDQNIGLKISTEYLCKIINFCVEAEFNVKTKIIVTDFCDGPNVYEHIKAELENIPVAILVNNVAMTMPTFCYVEEMPAELCWHMMYVNIGSAVMMTNLILPQMKQRKKGAIINISSAAENVPLVLNGLYSSPKAFLKHFSLLLKTETASFGITVQVLSPLFIKTNMVKVLRPVYKSNSFWIPNGDTYAKHAIKTLGYSECSTGFWGHGLWFFFIELIPTSIKVQAASMVILFLRRKPKRKSEKDR